MILLELKMYRGAEKKSMKVQKEFVLVYHDLIHLCNELIHIKKIN